MDPDPDLDLDPENRKVRQRADVVRNGRGTEEKTSVTSNLRSGALLEDFGMFFQIVGPRKSYYLESFRRNLEKYAFQFQSEWNVFEN